MRVNAAYPIVKEWNDDIRKTIINAFCHIDFERYGWAEQGTIEYLKNVIDDDIPTKEGFYHTPHSNIYQALIKNHTVKTADIYILYYTHHTSFEDIFKVISLIQNDLTKFTETFPP